MPGLFLTLIVIACLTAVLIAVSMTYQAELRRKVQLTQRTAVRGAPFDAEKDDSHDLRYAHFSIFVRGRNRYAFNTVRGGLEIGNASWPVQFGDYHFETMEPEGKQLKPQAHVLSYVLVETPYLGWPDLHIRPKGLYEIVADLLGFEEIHFESAEFNDRFSVHSRDRRFAYDVLHPRMMEFLLDGAPPTIDFSRGQCCLSMGERCWSNAEFEAMRCWTAKFFALWPHHVTTADAGRHAWLGQQE